MIQCNDAPEAAAQPVAEDLGIRREAPLDPVRERGLSNTGFSPGVTLQVLLPVSRRLSGVAKSGLAMGNHCSISGLHATRAYDGFEKWVIRQHPLFILRNNYLIHTLYILFAMVQYRAIFYGRNRPSTTLTKWSKAG